MVVNCTVCSNQIDIDELGFICSSCNNLSALTDIDYFAYLGILKSLHINYDLLEHRYITLMLKYHPDNFILSTDNEKTKSLVHSGFLNTAYETLKNETKRFAYLYKLNNNQDIIESEGAINDSFLFMEFFSYYEDLEQLNIISEIKAFQNKLTSLKKSLILDNQEVDFNDKDYCFKLYLRLAYIDKIIEKSTAKLYS